MDALSQQWLDFFAAGGREDFPYNMQGMAQGASENSLARSLGGSVPGALVFGWVDQIRVQSYFGKAPAAAPVLGISQYGLHMPMMPLLKWQDIAAFTIQDLNVTRGQATNGSMIPDPGVSPGWRTEWATLTAVVRNAEVIRQTIPSDESELWLKPYSTRSGQAWGYLDVFLQPALGPEQVIEFLYLVYLLAAQHNIPILQAGGALSGFDQLRLQNSVFAAN